MTKPKPQITNIRELPQSANPTEPFRHCSVFSFDIAVDATPATLEDPEDDDREMFEDIAIQALEQLLGYRFDEDSWYSFDWWNDYTVKVWYNEPYPARRLPLPKSHTRTKGQPNVRPTESP